ncbi:DNA polymerase III [Candidatus Azambacteria bacterium RIFCSPHIGHO2_01_FULL_44_55]|uniref:DNA polymerase beta n=1 Tax=Candidatus Azambacteria bacterium RIFCSPLOWO2_02_FULL_44_14 TaxID=1797306 RepID=A0A1F5CA98_9BACT|nr:MAG: DNA polymerase III [Candidatus Azambacteria bacterium RIFCSPLOWO2_01_FULL_44_84]OGD32833.1 MAG: DNA polymerase III [Candidatus Azambacteria bacterium RIFCSPHIGHO2_02_FULL_45_18]OGD39799.1 MAG: DNA polymerase III [Candidatus Azambacteria bacterium RIFCSPLOWO2_02_FULL_44_14]OGD41621.1 MAG: DNA polymerase III [Candidatus Azambacteria bacterium RIFCSPHIGHO2_01_FULL_44_55]
MAKVSNQEIAGILYAIGEYLEMQGVQFKPRAYEKAGHSVEGLEEDVSEIYKKGGLKAVEDIPGVGESIGEKIEELVKTGRLKYYEQLKNKLPVKIGELTAIEGVGPKMVMKLYKELGIKDLKTLEKSARAGKIAKLEGFGKKSEEKILRGIEFMKKSGGRFILGFILPQIRTIENRLKNLREVDHIAVAGSARRWQETIGDLDILVTSSKPKTVMEFFVNMPEVGHVYSTGPTKTMARLKNGMDADLRVVPDKGFGAALQYFTGDKRHNITLRVLAEKKGYKLNEYGLWRGKKLVAGRTEDEIYKMLGMQTPPPEIRNDSGEIQAALKNKLPKLIGYGDVRGDLQVQTDWTDGVNSIEAMASEAQKLGWEYIAITDHTKSLAMTGGSDEKKLLKQMAEIDKLNSKFKIQNSKFMILKGAEVNIMKDGSLDIKDEVLAKLDVVGVAVHSHFNLSRAEQTRRIVKAMQNKNADILFHPTGRVIQRREAYDLDMDEIIKAAKETGTVLEIDAYPDRLDLKDEYIRKAIQAQVKLSIDTDAHAITHLHYLEFGIAQARRGWATKNDIINTRPWRDMLKLLK